MRDLVLVLAMVVSHGCVPAALTGGTQGVASTACGVVAGCDHAGGTDGSVVLPLALLAAVAGAPLLAHQLWQLTRT